MQRAGATAAALLLLLLASPTPAEAVRTLSHLDPTADATAPVVALASLLAWALTGWLLLCLALTVTARLPGLLGALAAALARRLTPAALRRSLELLLGVSVVVGPLGQLQVAAADAGAAASPVPQVDLDWPTPIEAGRPPAARTVPAPPADPPPARAVVVRPGDSLWAIAERDLRRHLRPAGDAAVAQAWPAWWSANRTAVGDDPDLIRPGLHLRPPPPGHHP